ncbi:MAG TPA: sensor histidine kinase [Spirochaetota bacterium]|nr:sensor histidine kinase [Spirochaetota bacterium]
MTEVEITRDFNLTDEQVIRCEMHSFTNLVNSIFYELELLAGELGDPEAFSGEMRVCEQIVSSFRNRDQALESVHQAESFARQILHAVRERIEGSGRTDLGEYRENIERMMEVVEVRTREMLARFRMPGRWVDLDASGIRDGLLQVLDAIAFSSHGRFGFVYDSGGSDSRYGFSLQVEGARDGRVTMPPVFIDCLRDLVANARKYTKPGGTIEATLSQTEEGFSIKVKDTGLGIPEDEIQQVVEFGVRGSNVREIPTRGGGFGLTKVWYATRQYGGRLWITSAPGQGTLVHVRVPRADRT